MSYSDIQKAILILKQGGLVVFPTDTAFAVSCRMDDKKAVERLFKWRKRPASQAAPVLTEDMVKMVQRYLLPIPEEVTNALIEPYWPGALTIVLPCKIKKVLKMVRGSGKTLGVRIPGHPIARHLIRKTDVPLLGPSANFHGASTPYRYQDLDKEFLKGVDLVLEGECPIGLISTVVDCSEKPWKIIRNGAVQLNIELFHI